MSFKCFTVTVFLNLLLISACLGHLGRSYFYGPGRGNRVPYSTDVEDFNELLTERDGNGNHKNHVSGKLHGENGVHEKICGPNMVILLIGHVQDGLRRFVESLPSIMRNNPIPHLVPEGRREPDASSESGESTEQDTLPEPDAGFESDEPWEAETHDTNNENVEALEALREKQERESPNHHRRLVVARISNFKQIIKNMLNRANPNKTNDLRVSGRSGEEEFP